ncbi:Hypothetical predicted protein [Cloeon dipterum]|uniref:Uncharacterized protein n=1 Tax=Cloeon dipterum TaxID=197152 RepID=A0A8S1C403_9INSE|nr:Hypothetical predicted protein [Cloeon dipterum]
MELANAVRNMDYLQNAAAAAAEPKEQKELSTIYALNLVNPLDIKFCQPSSADLGQASGGTEYCVDAGFRGTSVKDTDLTLNGMRGTPAQTCGHSVSSYPLSGVIGTWDHGMC